MTRSVHRFAWQILFTAVLGLGLLASHAEGRAERVVRVGFVGAESPSTAGPWVAALSERLREQGYVQGRNLIIEQRWAEGRIDQLPALMAEIMALKVDVLVTYSTPAALAAKNAGGSTPIVVAMMGDPVGTGLAASLARPGGNLTGLSLAWTGGIQGKWLELLQETVPKLSTVAVIANPDSTMVLELIRDLEAVAPARGLKLRIVRVRTPEGLPHAFEQARREAQAVLVLPDPLTVQAQQQIVLLSAKHRLPSMYALLEVVDVGGLLAYGVDTTALFRRTAGYVDKILQGAKPGDLPIEQATQYALAVNLKTAKAIGITIPETILLRAEKVVR
jgi:putative tryptophan/tyrosine transport system substrate-binding protein